MELPTDVERFVHRYFAASEVSDALRSLEGALLHDGREPSHRMIRCAVVASNNSLDSLKTCIDGLATDFRDIVVAGEYEKRDGTLVQVRDLSRPFELSDE